MTPRASTAPSTVIFDLGGVLIDWDPYRPYRDLLPSDDAIRSFFDDVQIFEWNAQQDAGRPFAEAVAEHSAKHPEHAHLIAAWHERWEETIAGPIAGTVDVLRELRDGGAPIYALTNWSAEKFPIAQRRFEFLEWFDGVVVSGVEQIKKPDPRIYQVLFDRYGVDPRTAVFIDDTVDNVTVGKALGLTALHFTDPATLRSDLSALGLVTNHQGAPE